MNIFLFANDSEILGRFFGILSSYTGIPEVKENKTQPLQTRKWSETDTRWREAIVRCSNGSRDVEKRQNAIAIRESQIRKKNFSGSHASERSRKTAKKDDLGASPGHNVTSRVRSTLLGRSLTPTNFGGSTTESPAGGIFVTLERDGGMPWAR